MAKLIIQRKQKQAQYFTEDLGDGVGLDMVLIPSGSFWMGTEDVKVERLINEYGEEWFEDETPQHKVKISRFFVGRYPITRGQWRAVAGWDRVETQLDPDPSKFKDDYEGIDRWTRPVENISWDDAVEFCNRLSLKTEREYCLPTEAEWEYACRGVDAENLTLDEWNGKYDRPFHFGETISTDLANYRGIDDKTMRGKGSYGKGVREQTTPVGYFKVANSFGLSDMHGLVWEWCKDDWHDNYDNAPNDGSVKRLEGGNRKVLRGGSWDGFSKDCRSAIRFYVNRGLRDNSIGFRVMCVAPRNI